jgi:hypothetical protein
LTEVVGRMQEERIELARLFQRRVQTTQGGQQEEVMGVLREKVTGRCLPLLLHLLPQYPHHLLLCVVRTCL